MSHIHKALVGYLALVELDIKTLQQYTHNRALLQSLPIQWNYRQAMD